MPETSSVDHALGLWRRGLSVSPVPRPRPGVPPNTPGDGKTPEIKWDTYQKRRPTECELRAWFRTPQNIAIVTGQVSGVVAIDVDSPEATTWATRRLPYTPWQTRTAKGFHLFYQHPGIHVGNRVRVDCTDGKLELDVRGDGGYVIAPGSIHQSGAHYEFAGDWTVPREQLPRFWVGWLARPTPRSSPRSTTYRPVGDIVDRARRYLAAVPVPEIGHGSDQATLSAACRLVRGFELSETDATALLWDWAGGRSGWSPEWIARKVRNAAQYGSEPVGALR